MDAALRFAVTSLGAGTQSSAMLLLGDEGRIDPRPDYAIFADTQDESTATMAWLEKLDRAVRIPIIRWTAGKLSDEVLRSMRETKSGFCPIPTYIQRPDKARESQGRRQCTRTHKAQVVYDVCSGLIRRKRGERWGDRKIEVHIGISTDEASRMKPSRYPGLVYRWPLIEMGWSRKDCAEYLLERMGEVPPKSSCVYCPFRSDPDWARMKKLNPSEFQQAVDFEARIRRIDPAQFLHDSCKPLAEVRFEENRQLDMFDGDCEGMCGV